MNTGKQIIQKQLKEFFSVEKSPDELLMFYDHNINGINDGVWKEFMEDLVVFWNEDEEIKKVFKGIDLKKKVSEKYGNTYVFEDIEEKLKTELKPFITLINTEDSFSCALAIAKLPFNIQLLLLEQLRTKVNLPETTTEELSPMLKQAIEHKQKILQQVKDFSANKTQAISISDFVLLLELECFTTKDYLIIEFFSKLFLSPTKENIIEKYGDQRYQYIKTLLLNSLVYKKFFKAVKKGEYKTKYPNKAFTTEKLA